MAASISRLRVYKPGLEGGTAMLAMASTERLSIVVDETGALLVARRAGRMLWRAKIDGAALARLRQRLIAKLDDLPELPEPHRFDRRRFIAAVPDPIRFFGNRDPDAVLRASEPALALLARVALAQPDGAAVVDETGAVIEPRHPRARPLDLAIAAAV